MGDFNTDIRQTSQELSKLEEFCRFFSLTNILKSDTCFTKFHRLTIHLFHQTNLFLKKQTSLKLDLATIKSFFIF